MSFGHFTLKMMCAHVPIWYKWMKKSQLSGRNMNEMVTDTIQKKEIAIYNYILIYARAYCAWK